MALTRMYCRWNGTKPVRMSVKSGLVLFRWLQNLICSCWYNITRLCHIQSSSGSHLCKSSAKKGLNKKWRLMYGGRFLTFHTFVVADRNYKNCETMKPGQQAASFARWEHNTLTQKLRRVWRSLSFHLSYDNPPTRIRVFLSVRSTVTLY